MFSCISQEYHSCFNIQHYCTPIAIHSTSRWCAEIWYTKAFTSLGFEYKLHSPYGKKHYWNGNRICKGRNRIFWWLLFLYEGGWMDVLCMYACHIYIQLDRLFVLMYKAVRLYNQIQSAHSYYDRWKSLTTSNLHIKKLL